MRDILDERGTFVHRPSHQVGSHQPVKKISNSEHLVQIFGEMESLAGVDDGGVDTFYVLL